VFAIGEVAPILGSVPVPYRRVTCSRCGRPFLVPDSSGTMRGPPATQRWTCDVPAPFHLRAPERVRACPGSDAFAVSQEEWRPRSGRLPNLSSTSMRLFFADDPRPVTARARFERA
jgi:hypothetical protein